MASVVLLKASGLQTSPNELQRDDGALIEANNIIIKRDNIIEQRRGFKVYGRDLPGLTDRAKQLTTYRNTLIRHFQDQLQFDSDGQGAFENFVGRYLETEAGLRMKFIEASGNFYFTTSEGVKKISARNREDLFREDVISSAGAVKAVDFTVRTTYTPNQQTDFFVQDSAVSYRVVWGYKDLNNNLILGSPSQRVVASNPMIGLLLRDYTRVLQALDSFSNTPLTDARIADKNYISTLGLTLNNNALDLYNNLVLLTEKIDLDILLADQVAAPLQITGASVASGIATVTLTGPVTDYIIEGLKLFLGGTWALGSDKLEEQITVTTVDASSFTFNTAAPDGSYTLTTPVINYNEYRSITKPPAPLLPASNDDLLSLQIYIEDIIARLSVEPETIISSSDQSFVTDLDVTTSSTVELQITIPNGINSNYFVQVYRSNVAQALGPTPFEDVVPNDELQLVYEAFPTPQELEDGQLTFIDVTPDDFRGANLYTNAATGEGILQSNDIPPFAKDITRYRNSTFYANTRTQHRLFLNLLGVVQMINDFDNSIIPTVTISNKNVTNTYRFIVGKQEITEITTTSDISDSLNGAYFYLDSVQQKYYVYFETTTAVDPAISGRTGIKVNIPTDATADQVATAIKTSLATKLDEFIVNVTGNQVEIICYQTGVTEDAQDISTGFTISVVQQGSTERVQPEITKINTVAGSLLTASGPADYFTLNAPFDQVRYYIWFNNGVVTDPAPTGLTGIEVPFNGSETADQIASAIQNVVPEIFEVDVSGNELIISTVQYGQTVQSQEFVADSGFTVTREQEGALDVLLSPLPSPARAVDETARSFVRVINKNPGESVYGYYTSSAFDVPGKMLLESRSLIDEDPFYVIGNNDVTGISFNPDIGPEGDIVDISVGTPSVITTSTPHGLVTGEQVVITSTDSIPQVNGLFTITYVNDTSFSVNKPVTSAGSSGKFIRAVNSVFSENENKPNRVYYSKFLQPDAVPIANFFDVGSGDMKILRIYPLRDSLFVFKEDGLYRISGDAPFNLELFDNSFILLAPDSVAVSNNVLYAWTTQGIQSLTEGGSTTISRPIDNILFNIQSANYPNFKTATWGVGYESDNSYLVFTVKDPEDTVATIAYRYSTLTNTWTTYDKSSISGVVNMFDDKLYLSASDIPNIEQERKTFSRLDYADREYETFISNGKLLNNTIILPDTRQFSVGDVFVQDQTLTAYEFNNLLDKIDYDPGPADVDYLATLRMLRGENPRTKLIQLAQKLDADSNVAQTIYESSIENKLGTIVSVSETNPAVITTSSPHGLITGRIVLIDSSNTTPSINGTHVVTVTSPTTFSIPVSVLVSGNTGNFQTVVSDFRDLKTCYNEVIRLLNIDTGVSFTNFKTINNNIIQEAIIISINNITKTVTLDKELDFLVGAATVFKSIKSSFAYSPTTMGDPLNYKHLREATMMFETRNITSGTMSFATDLLPQYQKVPFNLDGNGIFGHSPFGTGFFGGKASSAPFRTYIPRQCMRCRYILVRFEHSVAREDYKVTGVTITGEIGQSTRAYR